MYTKVFLCVVFLFLLFCSIGIGSYLLSFEKQSLISPLPDSEKAAVKGTHTVALLPAHVTTAPPIPTVILFPTIPQNKNTTQPTTTSTPTIPIATPTLIPSPTPTIVPIGAPADLESLFAKYGNEYSVDVNVLKKIAQCESGMNTSSHNTTYDYGGMFQFASSSWIAIRNQMGLNNDPSLRFHAEEAIKTAAYKISRGGVGAWPHCSRV